ncbi:molybdopterin converting factor subunit 1 [Gracilibacillus sp. YIM 98692]|uniref:molybdopterin converting factor subunit 1 n=1 Tax=Gracilibacillus sp. YIM 98692 TaxID=2663532 RepID=UPI0013D02F36|nr:molybdopterin converting factor subunit 1 [Gracilibacillus sp. YIM 98692]
MIEVLLFAQLQEDAGTDRLTLNIEKLSVKQLRKKLMETYNLQQVKESMVAVNEVYALDKEWIQSGDTVAIIPPVSGG